MQIIPQKAVSFFKHLPRERFGKLTHYSAFKSSHHAAHLMYFLAVAIEGHGFYAVLGAVLFFFGVVTLDGED